MTRRGILHAFGIVSVVAGAIPSLVRADNAIVRVALSYDVVAGCPDETAFRGQVRARTERLEWVVTGAHRHFAARVSMQGDQLVGRLDVQTGEGSSSSRQVPGKTCTDVISALALIAALAVDPNALLGSSSEPAAMTVDSATSAPLSPPSQSNTGAVAPAPVAPADTLLLPPSTPRTSLQDHPAAAVSHSDDASRWRTGFGAGLGAATGVFPSAAWLASIFVETSNTQTGGFAPSVRVSLSGTALQSYEASHGQAQYQWYFGTLDGCPLRFALGATSHVRACGFGEVGILRAGATGFDHLQAHSIGWGALGLLGRVAWSAGPWWFEGTIGPRFALNHPTYLVELAASPTPIHEVRVLGLAASTSLGFRLP